MHPNSSLRQGREAATALCDPIFQISLGVLCGPLGRARPWSWAIQEQYHASTFANPRYPSIGCTEHKMEPGFEFHLYSRSDVCFALKVEDGPSLSHWRRNK